MRVGLPRDSGCPWATSSAPLAGWGTWRAPPARFPSPGCRNGLIGNRVVPSNLWPAAQDGGRACIPR